MEVIVVVRDIEKSGDYSIHVYANTEENRWKVAQLFLLMEQREFLDLNDQLVDAVIQDVSNKLLKQRYYDLDDLADLDARCPNELSDGWSISIRELEE